MSVNRIRKPIHDRRKALGISLTDPSAEMVELAGRVGLDFVHFDGHHAPLTPERMGLLCQFADGFGITPTMRVPNQRESTILSYLDKGVRVIIVPNLQTREEAEALIRHAYYAHPPSTVTHRHRRNYTPSDPPHANRAQPDLGYRSGVGSAALGRRQRRIRSGNGGRGGHGHTAK